MSTASNSLILHCGGERVERSALKDLAPPVGLTATHYPIPHHELVRQTVEQIEGCGIRVANEVHAIAKEGNRYFGVFGLVGGDGASASDDYGLIVGIRNSHDQSYLASLALGTRVFVCDNLAFSGEVTIARKHTRHILRDLPGLMAGAVNRIVGQRRTMEERIATYKGCELSDVRAHDLIVRAIDAQVVSAAKVPLVLREWRTPSHPEFEPRTAWSLFNSFTECLKGYTADSMYARSQPLHGVFDSVCGLAIAA